MSDIAEAFGSPPFTYKAPNGRLFSFERMRKKQWVALTAKMRQVFTDKENLKINRDVPETDKEQRARARTIASEYVRKWTSVPALSTYVTNEVEGIDHVLETTYIGSDWPEVEDEIPQLDKVTIAQNLVFLPIVNLPQNPSTPAGNGSPTDTSGPNQNPTSTGKTSSDESSTSSPENPPTT